MCPEAMHEHGEEPEAAQQESAQPLLLTELPDPCLLSILQFCATDDQRSLFNAARAHSRLHQAAVVALSKVSVQPYTQVQQVDGVLTYLSKHGHHVDSVDLMGDKKCLFFFRQLPPNLQLSSLHLGCCGLQLRPGDGFQGAAAGLAALKQLDFHRCCLLDISAGEVLAAALPAGLEHLSIYHMRPKLPTVALQRLQQLTYLNLRNVGLQAPDEATPVLQPLQALTRLVDLRLEFGGRTGCCGLSVTASMLSGMKQLSQLELSGGMLAAKYYHMAASSSTYGSYMASTWQERLVTVEPGALAGKTRLQSLTLFVIAIAGGSRQLLPLLQPLQQLTSLRLAVNPGSSQHGFPPAAAYSAVTASTKLQHLDLSYSTLPAGAWQHVFLAGRQLPVLQHLDISKVNLPNGTPAPAPAGSLLVSSCPALDTLMMDDLPCSTEVLAPLTGLSALRTLGMPAGDITWEGPAGQAVCQLAGLKALHLSSRTAEGSLLPLTQLKQLTALHHTISTRYQEARSPMIDLVCEAPGEEPVWRQLLCLHLGHRDPDVAQQAGAALVDSVLAACMPGPLSSD